MKCRLYHKSLIEGKIYSKKQESPEKFKLLRAIKMWYSSTRSHMGQQAQTTWRLLHLFRQIKRPLPWIFRVLYHGREQSSIVLRFFPRRLHERFYRRHFQNTLFLSIEHHFKKHSRAQTDCESFLLHRQLPLRQFCDLQNTETPLSNDI